MPFANSGSDSGSSSSSSVNLLTAHQVPLPSAPTTSVPTTSVPTTSVPTSFVPMSSAPTTSVSTSTSAPMSFVPPTSVPSTSSVLRATEMENDMLRRQLAAMEARLAAQEAASQADPWKTLGSRGSGRSRGYGYPDDRASYGSRGSGLAFDDYSSKTLVGAGHVIETPWGKMPLELALCRMEEIEKLRADALRTRELQNSMWDMYADAAADDYASAAAALEKIKKDVSEAEQSDNVNVYEIELRRQLEAQLAQQVARFAVKQAEEKMTRNTTSRRKQIRDALAGRRASTPVASTPVASTPVASTPVASTPVASTAVAPTASGLHIPNKKDLSGCEVVYSYKSRTDPTANFTVTGLKRGEVAEFLEVEVTIINGKPLSRPIFSKFEGQRSFGTTLVKITDNSGTEHKIRLPLKLGENKTFWSTRRVEQNKLTADASGQTYIKEANHAYILRMYGRPTVPGTKTAKTTSSRLRTVDVPGIGLTYGRERDAAECLMGTLAPTLY